MHRHLGIVTLLILIGSTSSWLRAQTTTAAPAFDVASVKPASRDVLAQGGFGCGFLHERFKALGSAAFLIACAYQVPFARIQQLIIGGPQWMYDDLFDVLANAPADQVPRTQVEGLAMLRTLLADRFELVLHREARDDRGFALVMARRDGKLGPQLRPASAACTTWIAGGRRGAPPDPPAGQPPCVRQFVTASTIRWSAMPLSRLADALSARLQRPVQDRTGLDGYFDMDLRWAPEPSASASTADNGLPTSIGTALHEQLGLDLQSTTSREDVIVIDHIERPAAN